MTPFDYITRTYNVPAAIGRRVIVNGKPGTIIEDRGHHIGVNFDTDRPGRSSPCHPTWEVKYLEEIVKPRKASRGAQRYRDWLRSESSLGFIEWIEWTRFKSKEAELDYR